MSRIAVFLTLAGTFAALSATTAMADSGSCKYSDLTDLHTYLHSAQFHATDDLGNYSEDLSAYGTPLPTAGAHAAPGPDSDEPPALDMVRLRSYFHGRAFQSPDGLTNYGADYRAYETPSQSGQVARIAQNRP